jgi:hypothetical protein
VEICQGNAGRRTGHGLVLVRNTIKWCIVSAILLTKVCAGLIPEVKASNTSKLNDEDLKEIKRRAQERRLELFHQCYEHLLEKIKKAAETGIVIHHKKGGTVCFLAHQAHSMKHDRSTAAYTTKA